MEPCQSDQRPRRSWRWRRTPGDKRFATIPIAGFHHDVFRRRGSPGLGHHHSRDPRRPHWTGNGYTSTPISRRWMGRYGRPANKERLEDETERRPAGPDEQLWGAISAVSGSGRYEPAPPKSPTALYGLAKAGAPRVNVRTWCSSCKKGENTEKARRILRPQIHRRTENEKRNSSTERSMHKCPGRQTGVYAVHTHPEEKSPESRELITGEAQARRQAVMEKAEAAAFQRDDSIYGVIEHANTADMQDL